MFKRQKIIGEILPVAMGDSSPMFKRQKKDQT